MGPGSTKIGPGSTGRLSIELPWNPPDAKGTSHSVVRNPPALRPGDQVMLVSPSGPTRPERVERGIELLTHWGLRVLTAPNVYARAGYLAGSDEQRLAGHGIELVRPARKGEQPRRGARQLRSVRQIIESVNQTLKDNQFQLDIPSGTQIQNLQ